MGLFDFLKKKETPKYDVTNLSIKDLDQGFIFDYDMKSWVVKEVYQYDWGNNNISKEFLIDSGEEVGFLGIEDKGEPWITFTKTIKIRDLGTDIIDRTVEAKSPPKILVYQAKEYHLHNDSAGYFNDITKGTDDWEELIAWELYDDNEENLIGITQWGEREFDAVAGVVVKEFQISNIIPGTD